MFFDFLEDIGNYEDRKVDRTICANGIIVSTAFTSDEGYETALIDRSGAHPVERYGDKQEAINGHSKWVKFAENGEGKEIEELMASDFKEILGNEIITLQGGA